MASTRPLAYTHDKTSTNQNRNLESSMLQWNLNFMFRPQRQADRHTPSLPTPLVNQLLHSNLTRRFVTPLVATLSEIRPTKVHHGPSDAVMYLNRTKLEVPSTQAQFNHAFSIVCPHTHLKVSFQILQHSTIQITSQVLIVITSHTK